VSTTDQAGVFEVRGVADGGYFLLTTASKWLFRYGDVVSLSQERTEEISLELERGASIAGRVVRASGEGMPGVRVIAEFTPPSTSGVGPLVRKMLRYVNGEFLKGPFEVFSGEDGSFEISSLPPGIYSITAYSHSETGSEFGLESTVPGVETGTKGVVVYYGDPAYVVGTLMTPRGFPLIDVPVQIERLDQAIQLPFPGAADFVAMAQRMLGEEPRRVNSDEFGQFSFGDLGAGRYRLTIETPGLKPHQQELSLEWGMVVDLGEILVDPGESISGRVISNVGAAIPDATVQAILASGGMMSGGVIFRDLFSGRLQVKTDADGRFEIMGLRTGEQYEVLASAVGYAPETQSEVRAGEAGIELELQPGVALRGVVLRSDTGEGLEGATVRSGASTAETDREGRFELKGVIADGSSPMMFMGRSPRWAEPEPEVREVEVQARASGYMSGRVMANLDGVVDELVITVDPIATIRGTVIDPTGAPQPGALVRLTPDISEDMGPFQFDTSLIMLGVEVTDERGEFVLDQYFAEEEGFYKIIADFPGYTRGSSDSFRLTEADSVSPVNVSLRVASSISGVVTDGSGPVSGAVVRLAKASDDSDDMRGQMFMQMLGLPKGGEVVHTDSQGRFRFEAHEPGEFSIGAEMVGYSDSPIQPIALREGTDVEISLVLDPGSILTGTVTDEFGNPIADAVVRVLTETGVDEDVFAIQMAMGGALRTARTDFDGQYEVIGLPIGGYAAVAEKQGFAKSIVNSIYINGVATEHLRLLPAATLRTRVTDVANGRPVSEFEVMLISEDEQNMFGPRGLETINSPDGIYERGELEAGTYSLQIRAIGYSSATVGFQLQPGAFQEEQVELERAARLLGVVRDTQTGEPIANAEVSVSLEEDPGDQSDEAALRRTWQSAIFGESVRSDSNGSFLLEGVPSGTPQIVVNHENYVQLTQTLQPISRGEEHEIVLLLTRGLSVFGRIQGANGDSVGPRFLILRGNDDENRGVRKSTVSDEDGQFAFDGLESGAYRITTPGRGPGGGSSGGGIDVELQGRDLNNVEVTIED